MASGGTKGRPWPILASDTVSRSPVPGSTRTTASSSVSTTTRDPKRFYGKGHGKIKAGTIADKPLPRSARRLHGCTARHDRPGCRCGGRLASPPSAHVSTTHQSARGLDGDARRNAEGGPCPISVSRQLRCASIAGQPDTSVRSPVWGSTRTTANLSPASTTTKAPVASTAMAAGNAEARTLPDKRPKAMTLRIDGCAARHDRPVGRCGGRLAPPPPPNLQPRIDHHQSARGLYGKGPKDA